MENKKKCPICDTNEFTYVLFKSKNIHGRHLQDLVSEFNVYRCRKCNIIGLLDVDVDDLYFKTFYKQDYHSNNGSDGFLGNMWSYVNKFLLKKKIEKFKRNTISFSKLIDIGCGDGAFLKALDLDDFNAYGLEPIAEAAETARKNGLKVTHGNILDEDLYLSNDFDVVTMWHVFEHIEDPITALNNIKKILRPGGILVMSMPNTNSAAHRLGGENWFHLDSPRHLWLYNEKNIETLLENNGFYNVEISYLPFEFPLDMFWSLRGLLLGLLIIPFYPFIKYFDKQNMMIIARRNYF